MAKHLLDLGHRKVAYIAPPLTTRQKQRSKRVEGFLKEFDAVGLKDNVIIKAANESIDVYKRQVLLHQIFLTIPCFRW